MIEISKTFCKSLMDTKRTTRDWIENQQKRTYAIYSSLKEIVQPNKAVLYHAMILNCSRSLFVPTWVHLYCQLQDLDHLFMYHHIVEINTNML